jgi:hypothetical protein
MQSGFKRQAVKVTVDFTVTLTAPAEAMFFQTVADTNITNRSIKATNV